MTANQDWAALIGRILLAAIFIQTGFQKITDFAGTVAFTASAGLPLPEVAVALAIAIELGGGLLLLVGYRARLAALAIAVFCLVAAFVFHRYWSLPADKQLLDYVFFWKDLAIAGGMLVVFAFGPGRLSLDKA
ncbi:MAG TPA: DoxX family protein [Casimicrobiaceae bacterium]|jgi:putative oxidoreductase|nr:DoxX family protein [Casimicrobiaceae bacterium]